jgi:hypothetical protein
MIYIFGALIVVAVLAFYAGWHTGYSAGFVSKAQDEPIDWDKWAS